MALKKRLYIVFSVMALFFGTLFGREVWRWHETGIYNAAIEEARFAEAAPYKGDHGLFAKAYAEQQRGRYQDARILYGELENADDHELRLAVLFNVGNTYLQQASEVDLNADADVAVPLIELAKNSYRQLLRIDSRHWEAKFNLERALQLLPDSGEQALIDLEGRRNPIRTITSGDPEGDLP